MDRILSTDLSRAAPGGRAGERDFAFTPRDFERIRQLIYRFAGIALSDLKQDLVYGRLARRLRQHRLERFSDYLDRIEAGDEPEREAFINALTTNLTSFFREAHHFPLLAEQARNHRAGYPFRVWCSACSTGEEAYSLAIALAEAYEGRLARFEILASDLDTQVLARAREGVYAAERVEDISAERLRRFFLRGSGSKAGLVRVKPGLAERIQFARINLLDPGWPELSPFDAIFCRNVMIYFDKPTQRRLLERFLPVLEPDGRLYCGHSESLLHCADIFRNIGRTVYVPLQGRP